MDYPDGEMERLYTAFVEALDSGRDFSSFSKDDLIDVYDFSRGIPNDYVAAESIDEGLRRFPDDSDLIKRKAFLYHELGHDSICDMYMQRLPEQNFVRKITDLKNQSRIFDEIPDLRSCLTEYKSGSIEDGDIIYLVDIFEDNGYLDRVADCADELSGISQYPSTVYNELYNVFYNRGMYERALAYGQKLTDIEPFNASAWIELANLYLMKLGRVDVAAECAEYAIAIEPENVSPRMIKALTVYESNPDEAKQMVGNARLENADVPSVCYVDAFIDFFEGKEESAVLKISRSLKEFSVAQRREAADLVLRKISMPLPDEMRVGLQEMLLVDDDVNIEKWIENLVNLGCFRGACELYIAGVNSHCYEASDIDSSLTVAEAMYRVKEYDAAIELLQPYIDEAVKQDIPAMAMLLYSLSRYRSGLTSGLRALLDQAITAYEHHGLQLSASETIATESILPRLRALTMKMDGDEYVEEQDFDPCYKPIL